MIKSLEEFSTHSDGQVSTDIVYNMLTNMKAAFQTQPSSFQAMASFISVCCDSLRGLQKSRCIYDYRVEPDLHIINRINVWILYTTSAVATQYWVYL